MSPHTPDPRTPDPHAADPRAPRPGGPAPGAPGPQPSGAREWAAGGAVFAGVLLVLQGVLAILRGISGIAGDGIYTSVSAYAFRFDTTAWGWIHLVLGALAVLLGWGVLRGTGWGRTGGVLVTVLVVIGTFMWLPYEPFWAVIEIGLGIFVIWALCTDSSRTAVW